MSGKHEKEEDGEGERGREKMETDEQEQTPEGTKQTRVTWLGLGEDWGVVRDLRKMIYALLTPLERATVEKAHGVKGGFERHKTDLCTWAAPEGHLEVLQWAHESGCPWD